MPDLTPDHPLTEARAAELWGDHAPAYLGQWRSMSDGRRAHAVHLLRVAHNAGREHEREHSDPHHDPRPWQDCTREDIRAGDLVARQGRMTPLRIGVAHHQNENGDWHTKDGWMLTSGDSWPLRRIPASNPPAEEVELPTEFGAVITDVETLYGARCAHMTLDRYGDWIGVGQDGVLRVCRPYNIIAFTLPDGTRARRDGEREDGTPRFVKEDA